MIRSNPTAQKPMPSVAEAFKWALHHSKAGIDAVLREDHRMARFHTMRANYLMNAIETGAAKD